MVKIVFFSIFVTTYIFGTNTYETNCMQCHEKQEISLQMVFKKYLMVHSSKNKFKQHLKQYLKNPSPKNSVMPFGFVERFGTKEPTTLNEKELNDAIEQYYEKYAPKNRLK